MSGNKRFLLDTNAIVSLLQGNPGVAEILKDAQWTGISIISELEFLSFAGLSAGDIQCFEEFLTRIEVVGRDHGRPELIRRSVEIRSRTKLKLPDAIVAASAAVYNAVLISADRQLKNIEGVECIDF